MLSNYSIPICAGKDYREERLCSDCGMADVEHDRRLCDECLENELAAIRLRNAVTRKTKLPNSLTRLRNGEVRG